MVKSKNIVTPEKSRNQVIIRASVIGILTNIFLVIVKAFIGILSNSIAIILDAVNNLSDALSSVITIISMKLAGKAPNKKHPFGYGRVEYLSAALISLIVVYAGATSLGESIKKIIHPQTADYSTVTLLIVVVAIITKIVLGRYVKHIGEKTNSDSLIASGSDATMDSAISASTLVAAIIYITTGLSLEAWLGVIISILIIKSGIEMLLGTLNKILGQRTESRLAKDIKKTICENENVHGAFDLLLDNYGPNKLLGSVHVEVDDTMTANLIDSMSRELQREIYQKYNVVLATIGVYSINTSGDVAAQMRTDITKIVMSHDFLLQMHGFYVDAKTKIVNLDIIIDFLAHDRAKIYREILDELQVKYPDYHFIITMDTDISD